MSQEEKELNNQPDTAAESQSANEAATQSETEHSSKKERRKNWPKSTINTYASTLSTRTIVNVLTQRKPTSLSMEAKI